MRLKQIEYQNLNEALVELNAEDKGHYFICACPECDQNEAFMYKNNMNYIQCNRENQCGERFLLSYHEKDKSIEYENIVEDKSKVLLSNAQKVELDKLEKILKLMQKHGKSEVLEKNYRGLSKEILQPFVVDMQAKEGVQALFKRGVHLFPKNYQKNDFMTKRNLVFPVYGENEKLERILMRSSIDENIRPKEIQLILNPSKQTRDFFIDIPKESNTVVISESILDGLSFREVDKNIGLIALTGVNRLKKITQYLLKNEDMLKDKNIVLALDNDLAGEKASQKIGDVLIRLNKDYETFIYPSYIKDTNAYLNTDKEQFHQQVRVMLIEPKPKNKKLNPDKVFNFERG